MLQRLYAHNFRCFENFEFKPQDQSAALLLGKNGSGKSTVKQVLRIFQAIGNGTTRAGELVRLSDSTRGRNDLPMRFELEVKLQGKTYIYGLAFELPERFREFRVQHERLVVDGEIIFSREVAEVKVARKSKGREESIFSVDWHLVALPIIQDPAAVNTLQILREWMSRMVILAPIPQQVSDEAWGATTSVNESASNLADWLADLLEHFPAAYSVVIGHLQETIPDLYAFRFERLGRDARALLVQFKHDHGNLELPFSLLSDGEKCFFLSAVLLAANELSGPLFAFWDEPDNYLAPHEVSQFVVALKRSFLRSGGQLITTSHNPQAILSFSEDSSWVMGRHSHLEPSLIRPLEELNTKSSDNNDEDRPDLIQRLIDGDIDPWL